MPTERACDTPLVEIKILEDVFTDEQKAEMIEKVTDAVVSIEGESLRPYTWVSIEELKSGNIGIGGEQITSGGEKDAVAQPAK